MLISIRDKVNLLLILLGFSVLIYLWKFIYKHMKKDFRVNLEKFFDSYVLKEVCLKVFNVFYNYRLSSIINKKVNPKDKIEIEGNYIVSFWILSCSLLLTCTWYRDSWFLYIILGIALYRLGEIIISHLGNIINEQYNGVIREHPAKYMVYGMINFVEIIINFSIVRIVLEKKGWVKFSAPIVHYCADSLYYSIAALGFGDIKIEDATEKFFVIFQLGYFALFLFFIFPIVCSGIKIGQDKNNSTKKT